MYRHRQPFNNVSRPAYILHHLQPVPKSQLCSSSQSSLPPTCLPAYSPSPNPHSCYLTSP
jgi:hypothetical protein